MDASEIVRMFAALGQETRFAAVRQLELAGSEGLPSGELARALGIPPNTLSAHLSILVGAGLATSERRSRSIIYRIVPDARERLAAALGLVGVAP